MATQIVKKACMEWNHVSTRIITARFKSVGRNVGVIQCYAPTVTTKMHGLGTMNKNGELFADFCTFNDLVIGGSVFPHKMMHKATLVSPDGKTENQIDRITISRKWRRSLLETCTSKERSRCGIRPPPITRKCENKAEEIRRLSKLTTTTTIQCSQAKVKRKTNRVQLCCEEQV